MYAKVHDPYVDHAPRRTSLLWTLCHKDRKRPTISRFPPSSGSKNGRLLGVCDRPRNLRALARTLAQIPRKTLLARFNGHG